MVADDDDADTDDDDDADMTLGARESPDGTDHPEGRTS